MNVIIFHYSDKSISFMFIFFPLVKLKSDNLYSSIILCLLIHIITKFFYLSTCSIDKCLSFCPLRSQWQRRGDEQNRKAVD